MRIETVKEVIESMREGVDEGREKVSKGFEEAFEGSPRLFDGVEVRGIGRQVEEFAACEVDGSSDCGVFMK